MNLSELQAEVGALCNDPNHDRYSLSSINAELNNTQDAWNVEAKILAKTITGTLSNTGSASDGLVSVGLTENTPISFPRATWNGVPLTKVSRQWLDLFLGGTDWTLRRETPSYYFVDPTISSQQAYFHPMPNESGTYVLEYIARHDPMTDPSDIPFTLGGVVNYLMLPYHWGIPYSVSARLLLRDPSDENAKKSLDYQAIARNTVAEIVQVFKALEAQEPKRIQGGRRWKYPGVNSNVPR